MDGHALWTRLLEAASRPHGIGLSTAVTAGSAGVAAAAAVVVAVIAWRGYRLQRALIEPAITLLDVASDPDGDLRVQFEASNPSSTSMVLESVAIVRPKGAMFVVGKRPGTGGEEPEQSGIGASMTFGLPLGRAGSVRTLPSAASTTGLAPGTNLSRANDLVERTLSIRMPAGTRRPGFTLRFVTRVRIGTGMRVVTTLAGRRP